MLLRLLLLAAQFLLIHGQGPGKEARASKTIDMRAQFEVKEGLPPQTFVGRIPTRPGFTYRFNEAVQEFWLNGTTGELWTTREIDREALPTDRLDLVILSSQPTYPLEVRINVLDVNDNAPFFPEPDLHVTFSESANAGTRVFLDTAEDADIGVNGVTLEYKIVGGNEDGHFRVAVTTNPSGEAPFLHLETTGRLDRETRAFYKLNISAQDGGSPPKFGFLTVSATIVDVNDNPPIFDHSDYVVSLNELVPIGTIVLQVMATDNDDGDNAHISYYLSETETQFSVDAETGIITTMGPLNCQQNCPAPQASCPKSCVFTVFARDHGVPRQAGRTYVTVNLLDANDHDPTVRFRYFPPTASAATVDENAVNGSVVAAISVVDNDEGLNGDTVVTILSGNEMGHFRLESTPSFQLVRVNGVLDRERIGKYNLSIMAVDKGTPPRSSTAFLIIQVNDINDHEPLFEKSEYSAVLRELVPPGTFVASITATDKDTGINSQVFYSIVSGNEKMWFEMDAGSGLLTTRARLDREQEGTVRLKISARDGGPNPKWAFTQIKITILDENDEKPKFREESSKVFISEDAPPGTLIAALSASDQDQGTNGSIAYFLSPQTEDAYPNFFHLDSSSGKILSRSKLDREVRAQFELKVIAKDQGAPSLSSTATVLLELVDVNDNAPVLYPNHYLMSVGLDANVGTVVGQVFGHDLDEGKNSEIRFTLDPPSDPMFSLNEKTGEIKVKKELKSSRRRIFTLHVSAIDGGGRKSEEQALVEILIGGVKGQSHELTFVKEIYAFTVTEDVGQQMSRESVFVGKVTANGKKNSEINFSIIDGNSERVFGIEGPSGELRTLKSIDRELQTFYNLTILGRSKLQDEDAYGLCFVQVSVIDVNDNAPEFEAKRVYATIEENSPVGSEVLLVSAKDRDEGKNAEVSYSLSKNPNNLFFIHPSNGLIVLRKPLRLSDSKSLLSLEVTARDEGSPSLSSAQIISLRVRDVNDHTPVFDHSSYETSLLESTAVNSRFFTLQASDEDEAQNGEIHYKILEGNGENKFGVFPDGALYVKSSLDREEEDYYSLTILARDGGSPPRSSTVSLVIHVIDENDNAPMFSNATFHFYLAENEGPDTYVGRVLATDNDVGRNAELIYSIVSSSDSDFMIDPRNGFVKSGKSFDREALLQKTGSDFISLDIKVQDGGATRLKDKATIIIYITDENDNKPVFVRNSYAAQISEGAPIGSQVIRVLANDIDEGLNGDIVYFIQDSDGTFKIDSMTGQINLARTLDRESEPQYVIKVVAQDTAPTGPLSSSVLVTIDILDENDNMPEFTQSESRISIIETTGVNTELIRFGASDPDLGLNAVVSLSISGGNRGETFRIDPKTGYLYLNKPLDYERISTYTLNITASDGGNPKLSSSIQFLVVVEDFNDNAPIFPSTAIVRQIQEGIPIQTPIVTVAAEDPDSGLNGKVKYSILRQEPEGSHFGIDENLGVIHTLKNIDREFADTFRLHVLATDQAVPTGLRLSAEKLVTVIVEDLNDNEPQFKSMNAAVLKKGTPEGFEVLKVRAEDLDSESNGVVTFEIVNGDRSLFALDRTSGSLKLKQAVIDVQPRYQLKIKATDEAIQSQRKASYLDLTILGVSEEGTGSLHFAKSLYKGSISENEPVGSSVLTVAALEERRTSEVEYYITNITSKTGEVEERVFDIDVRGGIISTLKPLDREKGVRTFLVEIYGIVVSTKGLLTASTTVEIELLDKNDSPPRFPDRTMELSVSENAAVGQQIVRLEATDEDVTGTTSYSLVGGDEGKFSLQADTGILRIVDTIDREEKEEYRLIIRASDGIQFSDMTLLIKVIDTNDNPPSFSDLAYSFDIPEDVSPGLKVGTLTAHDNDEGLNGQITFSVLSDWGNDVFSLNPHSGIFTLTSRLDYEEVQHYIFVVQAQDKGKPSLSSTATVYLNVVDLNDNAPQFDPVSYNKEVPENVSVGSSIVKVSATDLDSGLNGMIQFSIVSGNENNVFNISENGTILTSKSLDRETKAYYNLIVQGKDRAPENPLSSFVQVNIVLKDVNDIAPEFVSPNETTIMENSPLNTLILAVKARDEDEGRNGYIEYVLNNEKTTFSLGPVDGLLRLIGPLDREIRQNYSLNIIARDRGEPSESSAQKLFVRILDVNDNSPIFDPRQYSAVIPENSSIGMSILQVSATDVDEGLNSQIRYSIIEGDHNMDFSIGEDSGVLRLAKSINYERKKSYTLTVQAEDSAHEVRFDTAIVSISVFDINDNPPYFPNSPYLAFIRENMEEVPAYVLRVTANDADMASSTSQIRYLMKDGDKGSFRVNASTGEITVHRALDRERQAEYILTIVALDTGTPRLTGTGMVRVIIKDVNDNTPKFEHEKYEFSIEENVPEGTLVTKLLATDSDEGLNAQIRYSIREEGIPFAVHEGTGELRTIGRIDREEREIYTLTVEASDSSPVFRRNTSTTVVIRIIDLNDNVPTFDHPRYAVSTPDNIGSGGYVLGLLATDKDDGLNSKIIYYLGGRDADKFQIDQDTGVVKALRTLKRDSSEQLELEILATDSSPKEPLSSAVNVVVTLVDHKRFVGIKPGQRLFSFSESAKSIFVTTIEGVARNSQRDIALLSDDRTDGGMQSFSLFRYFIGGGNIGQAFEINPKTGQLKISANGLDFETAEKYELWIEVSSVEEPELRSSVPLFINVSDANDNAPVFEHSIYSLSVLEEEPGPKLIHSLKASDRDTGENGKVKYSLSAETSSLYSSLFGLDSDSGEIFAKVKLDREEKSQYTLTVEAKDFGSPSLMGTSTVVINVLDKNDNPPRFTRLFSVNVTENVGVGTFVIQVTSVDKDVGENANCTYIFTDNQAEKFKIDPLSGNITVSGMLDRETQDEYLLKVAAIDGSWRAETLVTLTIQDVNDNAPEFDYSYYNFNIPEGDSPVSFVGQVMASDRDKRGQNSLVTYSLKQPSDFFSIDPVSGEIFSKRPLKYKAGTKRFSPENEYTFTVIAADSGKPPMSSECSIAINVVDGNNNAPVFTNVSLVTPVLESFAVGHKVLHLKAIDEDVGVNGELEYHKISGNGSDLFNIEKETGWVSVARDLEGRKLQKFLLQVRALDKGIPPLSDDIYLTFVVTGTNSGSPAFSALSYRVIVPENEILGTVIVTVTATDPDPGPNGEIFYNITKGNEEGKFAIDTSTGAVSINKELDFDTKKEYFLNISATDFGYEPRSSEAQLTVILTDVNDNAPTFPQPLYTTSVRENMEVGSKLMTLKAVDKDSPKNAVLRYSIVGGSGKNFFGVDAVSGEITTKKVFDFEEENGYFLEVVAANTDSNLFGATQVAVNILGENEFFPKFVQPVFHFTISESAPIGSNVGGVQAIDEDRGSDGEISYLFVGSSNDRGFSIGPKTGAISVSKLLDRESQSRVVLTVLAKNGGSIKGNDTDEAQVIITVQDGNDPPIFEKETYEVEIFEETPLGSKILAVKATDIDVRPSNNRFSYEILSGNKNKTFKIDPISGVISTSGLLDRETVPMFTLSLGAIDTGQPPQTGTTVVKVNILDINDNGPLLDPSSLEGAIFENEPPNTKVMTLQASDADLSPNGKPFTYLLVGGPDASKFKIDPKTGRVLSSVSFDREANQELRIIVEIQDNGSPPMRSRQDVKITVRDKNDSPSQSRNAQLLLYTFKDQVSHDKVASVEPLDPDAIGQYSCRLDKNEEVFRMESGCNLYLNKFSNLKRQSIKVYGDDGIHSEVVSLMLVEFYGIDNRTLKNSVIVRAIGTSSKKFLEKSFTKLISFFRQIFRYEPHIYSINENSNGTDFILAVGSGTLYEDPAEITKTLLSHRSHIENLLDVSTVHVNFSPCDSQNPCQNGASCYQSLRAHSNTRVTDSPLLIVSSPNVQMEFSCQCLPGFTGVKCQLRKEPCQPSPCEAGGSCTKHGFDFHCACPPHRHGKRCELNKSSSCYSNPCKNGGSCQENPQSDSYYCLCRPGFFGNHCQTAADACRPNPCMNGGECVSTVASSSAFPVCKCPNHYYGRYCEKSAHGFSYASFMSFPSLDPNTNDISLVFSTNKKNALLVYNYGGQTGGRSDFVAIEIINGKASLSYGGARTAISVISVNKVVSDSKWYRIIATRNGRVISLSVSECKDSGENCEDCRPGDSTCYADEIGPTGTLNFDGNPVFIGGVPSVDPIIERPGQIHTDDFIGCIHSLIINGRALNLSSPLGARGISDTCLRVPDVCDKHKCGSTGECIDLWDSYTCRCSGVMTQNCEDAFTPLTLGADSYIEFKIGEKFRRVLLLQSFNYGFLHRKKREIYSKSISFTFRTIHPEGVLFYAASDKDYTLLMLDEGEVKFSSKVGTNFPINMSLGARVVDGEWHTVRLSHLNQVLQISIDGERSGEELDSGSVHDFLDPYLTTLMIGGLKPDFQITNKIHSGFMGCISNFSINDELQPLNESGSVFEAVGHHGKIGRGCSSGVAGAATAPDPLSIGVTLVIVFFVILLVAILVSFVVFRLRKREKSPLPPLTPTTKQSSPAQNPTMRNHSMEGEAENIRNLVRNSKKMSDGSYQKPDIILERTTSGHLSNMGSNRDSMGNGISMEPELAELPEHYDLENASSIAPSDIDIVYHYKGFRENLGGRKSSPFRHNHFPGSRQSPAIRQSPISNVLKSTPLARLSPSSELSQQTTPRILTLQDISGKPLQSALLATTTKDAMSQSERSLNISQSSSRSSIVNPSSQGTKKKRKGGGDSDMSIGLTAEEIERLNSSRHKNNSSLVSTLDAVSSSESGAGRKKKKKNPHRRDTSSDEDESGNDSFSCSEFEYDNEKRSYPPIFPKLGPGPETEEPEDSFRGSLSTLVASDDDLAYINNYSKNPKGEPSSMGWDYLLNWGPNYENLMGVFKDIAELPDVSDVSHSNVSPVTGLNNLGSTSRGSQGRSVGRYPTPRPSEEYV